MSKKSIFESKFIYLMITVNSSMEFEATTFLGDERPNFICSIDSSGTIRLVYNNKTYNKMSLQ